MLLAFGASFPGDLWVRSMVSRDMKVELKHTLFVFPAWLTLTVMIFAVLVTTLAALYPRVGPRKLMPFPRCGTSDKQSSPSLSRGWDMTV